MGVCSNIFKPTNLNPSQTTFNYPRKCTINVKNLQKSSTDPYNFILTDPIHLKSEEIQIESSTFLVSQCILPGIDPRGQYFKKCQDNSLVLSTPTALFVGLFDGHGQDGIKVVNFCSIFTEKFFHSHWCEPVISNQYSPRDFLISLCESCEEDLQSLQSRINSSLSGTSAVFLLFYSNTIYTASLGDCRAILGTKRHIDKLVPFVPIPEEDIIPQLKQKRQCPLDLSLQEVQLTRDLKPEDSEEYKRIIEAGGKIRRFIDVNGNKVGPLRIWHSDGNSPGLTMTRSFGDKNAKEIGIIAIPFITELQIDRKSDLFIVIASDGIWHCMDNLDVVNFVQFYRPFTCREIVKHRDEDVNVSNSCIAQILCEEARARWLMVVEQEDVEIDDIGCIVIEISKEKVARDTRKSKTVKLGKVRKSKRNEVVLIAENALGSKTPGSKINESRDPKRASHINNENICEEFKISKFEI